jgi:hypothetical protein
VLLLDPVITLPRDDVLREDEPATHLCVLLSGKVQLQCAHVRNAAKPPVKAPETLGAFAALHKQRHVYTATVRCLMLSACT